MVVANNNPQAAIISLEMLDEYNQLKNKQELLTIIESIQTKNRDKDPMRVLADVTRDVEGARRKIYEETFSRQGKSMKRCMESRKP